MFSEFTQRRHNSCPMRVMREELVRSVDWICMFLDELAGEYEFLTDQKRYEKIVAIHKAARFGAGWGQDFSYLVANSNRIPVRELILLQGTIAVPYNDLNEIEVFRYDDGEYVFPEYVKAKRIMSHSVDRRLGHDESEVHRAAIIALLQAFWDIVLLSLRLINQYELNKRFDSQLMKRLFANNEVLAFLESYELSLKDIINFVAQKDKAILEVKLRQQEYDQSQNDRDNGVGKKCSEELTAFSDFILQLEKEGNHRRNIFLAIAAYDYLKTENKVTSEKLWNWMEINLSKAPYMASYCDTPIEIHFISGVIKHKGLVQGKNDNSQIAEKTFRKVYYKDVHPLARKIKKFLQEKNIGNIPSIL